MWSDICLSYPIAYRNTQSRWCDVVVQKNVVLLAGPRLLLSSVPYHTTINDIVHFTSRPGPGPWSRGVFVCTCGAVSNEANEKNSKYSHACQIVSRSSPRSHRSSPSFSSKRFKPDNDAPNHHGPVPRRHLASDHRIRLHRMPTSVASIYVVGIAYREITSR